MAGVTLVGFEGKSLDETNESLIARLRGNFGDALPMLPDEVLTILTGIYAEAVSDGYAIGEGAYLAFDEAAAAGAALDNLSAISGTERLQATPSTITLSLTGDVGAVVPQGSVAAVALTGARFATRTAVTLVAVPAWASSTTYSAGVRVTTNNGTQRVYQCQQAGTSASSGVGPSGTSVSIADGSVTWTYLGDGLGAGAVPADCTVPGPTSAVARSVTQVATPVSGWRNAINLLDAVLGRNMESDAELRTRRRENLRGQGKGSVAAIRENVATPRLVPGVIAVTVFENDGDVTNSDGMPPHSFEVLVEGGEHQDILNTIWDAKPAGIPSHGTTSGTVTDVEGGIHTVRYTRPGIITIYVTASVQLMPTAPESDAAVEEAVKDAMVKLVDGLPSGMDVVRRKILGAITSISWVFDVPSILIGTSPGSMGVDNIPVTTRQRADLDTGNITLTLERLAAEDT